MMYVCILLFLFKSVFCTTVLYEKFDDGDKWTERWVQSTSKSDFGTFILTAGSFYSHPEESKGIKTSQDARFYALSRRLDNNAKFNNKDKNLVLQFTVKHEQDIDCGGGYIKLLPCSDDLNLENFNGDTPYKLMFGPDICGYGTKKVHAIINYNNQNYLIKKDIRCKDDIYSHVYRIIIKPDNTFEIYIDNEKESGNLEEHWDFLEPKEIQDPEAKKPEDWDDREQIDDVNDSKPEDWDKPDTIPDPDAKKPEDWDDEMDGEWEPPNIDNPEYKGEWKPRQIDNPNYKGKWVHPLIPNPKYQPDPFLYHLGDICAVGLDLWQVKSGSIFDNILLTDDIEFAEKEAEKFLSSKDAEKVMKEQQDEEATKKTEEEEKTKEKSEDEESEDEDEALDKKETEDKVHEEL